MNATFDKNKGVDCMGFKFHLNFAKEGGYRGVLELDHSKPGFDHVLFIELDTGNVDVLHEFIGMVQDEYKRGRLSWNPHYKGKDVKNAGARVKRRFLGFYPQALKSKVFGAFSPDGEFLGWLATRNQRASPAIKELSAVIKPAFKYQGITSAMLDHLVQHSTTMHPGEDIKTLQIHTYDFHSDVKRLAVKTGFKEMGTFPSEREGVDFTLFHHPVSA